MWALDEHGAVRASSAIAFDAFLSLIPLVAFAGYVLSRVHQSSALVLEPLIQSAPRAVAQAVSAEFVRMSMSSAVAPISITGFLWMSSAGVSTAMGVFETIYAANERPWYVRRAIAAGCVLASLAGIPLVAFLGVGLGTLSGSLGARLVAFTLPSALLVLLVAAFFKIAIRQRDVERRRIFPGALATVALWALVSALFSLYVATLARYATFYGSLATTAIFLLWLWLLALALMIGGEVNARLERERLGLTSIRPPGTSEPPDTDAIPPAPPLPAETITAADAAARGRAPSKRPGVSIETTQRSATRPGGRSDAPTRRSGELGKAEEIAERVAAGATSIDTTMRSSGVKPRRAGKPAPAAPGEAAAEEDATATVAAAATTPAAAPAPVPAPVPAPAQRGAARDPKSLASSE